MGYKGSWSRTNNLDEYSKRYEAINWQEKEEEEEVPRVSQLLIKRCKECVCSGESC